MTTVTSQTVASASAGNVIRIPWKALAPIAVALGIALLPVPAGLAPHAWYFFAIFVGVIVGLMFEPLRAARSG